MMDIIMNILKVDTIAFLIATIAILILILVNIFNKKK